MDVIKCFGFLRSLKQLFIISLISCFGLLGSSFVSAGRTFWDVGEEYTPSSQSVFTQNIRPSGAGILYGGGLSSAGVPLIMVPKYYSTYNSNLWVLYYYDSNSDLRYVARSNGNPASTTTFYGGKFSKFFLVNPNTFFDCASNNINSFTSCGGVETNLSIYKSRSDLKGGVSRIAYYVRDSGTSTSQGTMCLIFDTISVGMCFFPTNDYSDSTLENGATYNPIEFDTSLIGYSPWVSDSSQGGGQVFIPYTGSRLSGRLSVNSGYTNSDMVKGYECVGLQPALCYGGFDINNIFDPSEQFEDFTGYRAGQGATIFEIYNLYSGNFTSLNQFLNTVLTRYQNGQINSFKTEPKALLMLGAQMNTAGFKTSYIANYCNLLLNENNNNIYTGNSVDDLRVQSCLRSQKIGDSLRDGVNDIGFQTTTGGVFSGGDIDFDPDTFFSNIMDTIDRNLDQNLSGGLVGFLPGYIVLIFLALVFIRLITH